MTPTLRTPRHCLALHGFTGGGRDFEPLAAHLPGLRFEAPDLPGHGPGHLPHDGLSIDSCADTFATRISEGSVLLGYSLGARLALRTALLKAPAALVLVSGTPGIEDPVARRERRAADLALADRIESLGAQAFLKEWARVPIIATQSRASDAVRSLLSSVRQHHQADGLSAVLRGCGTGSMEPLWGILPSLTAPTLLITGEEDMKFRSLAEDMAARLPHAHLETVASCGHAPHFEDPRRVATLIERFLHLTLPTT